MMENSVSPLTELIIFQTEKCISYSRRNHIYISAINHSTIWIAMRKIKKSVTKTMSWIENHISVQFIWNRLPILVIHLFLILLFHTRKYLYLLLCVSKQQQQQACVLYMVESLFLKLICHSFRALVSYK